jgi:hypothetical protein
MEYNLNFEGLSIRFGLCSGYNLDYIQRAFQVGLIGIWFGVALSCFVPLLEKNSPLLEDLDNFLSELNDTFGETDRVQMATTKISFITPKISSNFSLYCRFPSTNKWRRLEWQRSYKCISLEITTWSIDIDRSHYISGVI